MKNQKGLSPIIVVVIIMILLGGYLFYQNQPKITPSPDVQNTTKADQVVENQYINTRIGYSLVLPEGWTACESGDTGGRVRVGKNQSCTLGWDESFIMDTALNRPTGLIERKQEESFLEWIKRYAQEKDYYIKSPDRVESEFITISPQVIMLKQTFFLPNAQYDTITYTKDIYIEDSQTTAFILMTEGPYGMDRDRSLDRDIVSKFPLEQFIPLIKSAPITTGDITGTVGKKVRTTTSIYPNFQGAFYSDDKKTVAAAFTANKNGTYLVRLKPGTYYFIYPDKKEEKIIVLLGKDTRFSPDIDESQN